MALLNLFVRGDGSLFENLEVGVGSAAGALDGGGLSRITTTGFTSPARVVSSKAKPCKAIEHRVELDESPNNKAMQMWKSNLGGVKLGGRLGEDVAPPRAATVS